MADCPVCGGENYHEGQDTDDDGAPLEELSGFCDDCFYRWWREPVDPGVWVEELRSDIIPTVADDLRRLKAALEHWDKEHPNV